MSPASFFQTCTPQAEKLYEIVEKLCSRVRGSARHTKSQTASGAAGGPVVGADETRGVGVVYDLFCGTGSIGLAVAKSCEVAHVYGFEIVAGASLPFFLPLSLSLSLSLSRHPCALFLGLQPLLPPPQHFLLLNSSSTSALPAFGLLQACTRIATRRSPAR